MHCTCFGAEVQSLWGNFQPNPPGTQWRLGLLLLPLEPPGSPGSHRHRLWAPESTCSWVRSEERSSKGECRTKGIITCAGGKLVIKLVFVGAWVGATGVMDMTGGAGVGMAMETGGLVIMGCWCWGRTGVMAIARAGRLGTGGEGNWLRISTFIAGRPLWNKGNGIDSTFSKLRPEFKTTTENSSAGSAAWTCQGTKMGIHTASGTKR